MALSFAGLIESYGLPDLLIPNSPLIRYSSHGIHYVTRDPLKHPIPDFTLLYQRTPAGDADFLRVRSQIELPLADWSKLAAARAAAGLNPLSMVEYRRTSITPPLIRISVESDTSQLSWEEVINASRERRILGVYSVRNFDYAAAVFGLALPVALTSQGAQRFENCYTFLFPAGVSIDPDNVPSDLSYDNDGEFWESNRSFFTRTLTQAESADLITGATGLRATTVR
jgi:hypothetical protein